MVKKIIKIIIKILKNKFKDFKVWCAASTHNNEEDINWKTYIRT